ncbi:MAG: VCBS repeat-containing protein, partial [Deltaproteobacteria bacterium]|nr:VCBS repeat-containing protein [Deltaproteobacteria bacterium]
MGLRRLATTFLMLLLLAAFQPVGWTDEPARIAIVPFKMNADKDLSFLRDGIVDMLTTRLSYGDKVIVIPKDETERAVSTVTGTVDVRAARKIGSALGADYVLFGSMTIFGESVSIDAKMIDLDGSEPPVAIYTQSQGMDSVIPKVDAFAEQINAKAFGRTTQRVEAAAPSQVPAQAPSPSIYAHPEKLLSQGGTEGLPADTEMSALNPNFIVQEGIRGGETFWKSQNFKEYLKGLSIGDVDGDGYQEIVFISDNKVFVYRLVKQQFIKVAEISGEADNNFHGIDVVDVNGNGKAEIFVTNLRKGRNVLTSFVLEWDNGEFVTIAKDQRWYYRSQELPSKGRVLFGQKRGSVDAFIGAVHEMGLESGEYVPVSTVNLPDEVNVFGFTMGDVQNNGSEKVVAFTDQNVFKILTMQGSTEWKSGERYGGSMDYLELEPTGEMTTVGRAEDLGKLRLYLPKRIFVQDLDGDGRQEVVVVKNYSLTGEVIARVRHFSSGEIKSLSWDGLGLSENWRTRKISGYVSDYAIADFDNDGENEIVALVVASKGIPILAKAKSAIISYDLTVPA